MGERWWRDIWTDQIRSSTRECPESRWHSKCTKQRALGNMSVGQGVVGEKYWAMKRWGGQGSHEGRITHREGRTGRTRRGEAEDVFLRWGEEAPEWENYCKTCLCAACWLLSGQSPDTVAFMVQEQGGNGFTVPPVCVTKFLQCFGVLNVLSKPRLSLHHTVSGVNETMERWLQPCGLSAPQLSGGGIA